ncbi:hypothetical protein DFO61_1414 [Ectopseudomonas oleovorans]|uniref:Uncharacterized protein n=2 Tax=Ectopseudomonas TaxID=3236654 RepID=A0A397NBH3_ECTOL|nr:hypothetical protein DFO61_1414 [Pseudomonas oleovorans]SFO74283.1 hypothetical protein SAMN05216601_101616 [Pseudomonas composti]
MKPQTACLPSPACGRGAGGEGMSGHADVACFPLSLTLSPKGAREPSVPDQESAA